MGEFGAGVQVPSVLLRPEERHGEGRGGHTAGPCFRPFIPQNQPEQHSQSVLMWGCSDSMPKYTQCVVTHLFYSPSEGRVKCLSCSGLFKGEFTLLNSELA